MKVSEKITVGVVAAVLIGLVALAAPVLGGLVPTAPTAVEETRVAPEENPAAEKSRGEKIAEASEAAKPKPRPRTPAPSADYPDVVESRGPECRGTALITVQYDDGDPELNTLRAATFRGEVQDLGPRPGANGTLSEDRSTYIVAAGDTLTGVSERVCIGWGGLSIVNGMDNDWNNMQIGQALIIDPRINDSWKR